MDTIVPQQFDPLRWGHIFALLSLDLVAPYVTEMRLQLPVDGVFVSTLRKLIRAVHSVQESTFAVSVWKWIQTDYDRAFADHLYRWGQDVFQYETRDGLNAFKWNVLVWRGELYDPDDDIVDPPPKFIYALRSRIAAFPFVDVGQKLPLTSWDRELFRREKFGELTLEVVANTVNTCNFLDAWQEALDDLGGKVNYSEIYRWGIKLEDIKGRRGDRLGKPGDWPQIPLPWRF